MKKIYYLLIFIFLFFPVSVLAEEILDFNVKIDITKNSEITIQERITYDLGSKQVHGIYRDIPYKYSARGGNYTLDIKVLNLTDENNNNINYTSKRSGGFLNIKIGDADKYVTGRQVYIITYEVGGAINYFDDHDELYWNVTGNGWKVNIASAKAEMILPGSAGKNNINIACYTGYIGSQESNCRKDIKGQNIYFQTEDLMSEQGLSVVVGWPKGIVTEPSFFVKLYKKMKDNIILLLPVFVLFFLYNYWRLHGRDPKGRGTIMPEYAPPENILPAEAGVVMDEKMDMRDLTATIIDLARRGYLKLKQEDKKALGFNVGTDWVLLRTEKAVDDLSDYEKDLINIFFEDDTKKVMPLQKIKSSGDIAHNIKQAKKNVYAKVTKDGWFVKNPETTRATLTIIGGAVIFGFFFFGGFNSLSIISIISILVTGVLIILFAQIMPKKTQEGAIMKEKLEGLKMFLSATEKDRVKFHFSPKSNPETFADYLPWAIIFEVEKEWANVFKGVDLQPPNWFVGHWATHYMAMSLVDSLGSFNNSFGKTMTAVTAGAAKGISGFGGGGFSGGGFGGGGGRSW
ncbi:MAG: DUF2207 domain-containing protein [Patescibacteria group bacterium]